MANYKVNSSRNRIEIYFDSKPSVAIRDFMKNNGFRWNSYERYWFSYYSPNNVEVAEQTVSMANGGVHSKSKPVSAPAPKTTKPKVVAPTSTYAPVVKKKHFDEDELVIFVLDGKEHIGEAWSYNDDEVTVWHVTNYEYGFGNREVSYIPINDVSKNIKYSRATTSPGRKTVVDFESDDGTIQKGLTQEDHYTSIDIICFETDSSGVVHRKCLDRVSYDRILNTYYLSAAIDDFLPFKDGERVEYINDEGKTKTGKVIGYTFNYEKVKIEYVEVDEWKDKWTYTDYVEFGYITKLSGQRKKLVRSEYISDDSADDIEFNKKIKSRIQARDNFVESPISVSQKPLFKHQQAGCLLAEKYNKFAFFYDTGTGKTVMALNIIQQKQEIDQAKFLIIAPKSIIKTAWLDDASNFFPTLRIYPLYKGFDSYKKRNLFRAWHTGRSRSTIENDKIFSAHIKFLAEVFGYKDPNDYTVDEIDTILRSDARHYIINSELFIINPRKYINEFGINGIIMDESAILKNYDSKTAKVMREICQEMKYVYLLSGKPAPNNETEFFSQMKIVAPDMFPFSYDRFLSTFCISQARRMLLNPENKALFAEMVSARSLIISKKDCLDLPDTLETVRLIDLPDDIMDDYNELYYECMVLIKGMDDSSTFYSSQSKMAILMKLRQMASGFFINNNPEYEEDRLIIDIHNAKINEVKDIISDIPDEQVIIWCQFQHEIELLEKELAPYGRVVTAYGKTKRLEENIDDFKNGRARFILAHPKTLKYGVTFTNCQYAIYYSFSYSAEDYDQSHDRNYRLGQKSVCTYFFIQAADTIDEIMYEKVMHKLSDAEFFERLIKDAAKHGIDYSSLKPTTEEKIKRELKKQGALEILQDQIVQRSQQREEQRRASVAKQSAAIGPFGTLDMLPEPDEYDLLTPENRSFKISDSFDSDILKWYEESCEAPQKKYLYYGDLDTESLTLEKILSDLDYVTVPDEYPDSLDFSSILLCDVPEKELTTISFAGESEELEELLDTYPTTEYWIASMYKHIFRALDNLPEHVAEVLKLKYGLRDGKKRAHTTICSIMGGYTETEYNWSTYEYEDKWYAMTSPKVTMLIQQGLESLKNDSSLSYYKNEVRRTLGIDE